MNPFFIEKKAWHFLLAFFSGVALVFAFAPAHIFLLGVIAPASLLWLLTQSNTKRAAMLGMTFGLGFFGVGVSWVFVAIYVFGGTPEWAAALITLLFVLVLAQFFTLLGYVLQRYFPGNNYSKNFLVFPALWALFEVLRSWIFTGFPWLILGHTVADSAFSGLAPVFGAYGCSFIIALMAALAMVAAIPYAVPYKSGWKPGNRALIALIILVMIAAGLRFIQWTKPTAKTLSVGLVQGNILQGMRWDPQEVNNILTSYYRLSGQHWDRNLLIWPEAAIPLAQDEARPFLAQIEKQLSKNNSALVTGIPLVEDGRYYNAAIGLGAAEGSYRKRHLVPFGEYVPFENWLRGLFGFLNLPMSNYLAGNDSQPLIVAQGVPLAVFICYEIAYDHLVRMDVPRAQVLVTISDDAWFGNSFAPWQHLQISQFQAAVTGRPMLAVGNDGVTAIVDPHGHIEKLIPQFQALVLTGQVMPRQGTTLWMLLGDKTWIILMLLLLGLGYKKCRVD